MLSSGRAGLQTSQIRLPSAAASSLSVLASSKTVGEVAASRSSQPGCSACDRGMVSTSTIVAAPVDSSRNLLRARGAPPAATAPPQPPDHHPHHRDKKRSRPRLRERANATAGRQSTSERPPLQAGHMNRLRFAAQSVATRGSGSQPALPPAPKPSIRCGRRNRPEFHRMPATQCHGGQQRDGETDRGLRVTASVSWLRHNVEAPKTHHPIRAPRTKTDTQGGTGEPEDSKRAGKGPAGASTETVARPGLPGPASVATHPMESEGAPSITGIHASAGRAARASARQEHVAAGAARRRREMAAEESS